MYGTERQLKETAKAAEAAGEKSAVPDSCKWGRFVAIATVFDV